MHLRPNCAACHRPLWDVGGTGRHPDPRCDPDRPPWWELPEWLERVRAIEQDRPAIGPKSYGAGRNPVPKGKEC